MKQILQNLKNGDTVVEDIPCPRAGRGQVLIATSATLVSAGTERMLVEFGKGNFIQKARQQPDKVRMVLDKMRTDGILPTIDAVRSKLDQALPMGYCNVGEVIEVGEGVTQFRPGDRVVSNGKHAERVVVPVNLCAKVPDNVGDESAVFTVLASIALHGVRLAEPTLGERIVVIGLGLVGLLTAQILSANGCVVVGFDFDKSKIELAKKFGINAFALTDSVDRHNKVLELTRGIGADAVIVAASTASSEPMREAVKFCRKKGRVVQVGLTGMELSRTDLFEKEVSVQVSCSYGPGRYDPVYEEKGQDYPISYVRWTEQRNFEAILDLLAGDKIDVAALISHRFTIDSAEKAYDLIADGEPSLGIVIHYPESKSVSAGSQTIRLTPNLETVTHQSANIAMLGSGNYAVQVLIPAFAATQAKLVAVASNTGVSAARAAKKFNFTVATTNTSELFDRQDINTIVVVTRHNTHANFVCKALQSGKNVFVEKPLALSEAELRAIEQAYILQQQRHSAPLLMVGFNRRFAPHVIKAKKLLTSSSSPKSFIYTINAGAIPGSHWTQNDEEGGGRIIGEACHFIDLLRYLAGHEITQVKSFGGEQSGQKCADNATITLTFSDGSIGTIHYFTGGHKSFPKERLEVFCDGKIVQIDNFRKLNLYGWNDASNSLWRQDKGNKACVDAFVRSVVTGSGQLIPFTEIMEVSRAAIQANDQLKNQKANERSPGDWF